MGLGARFLGDRHGREDDDSGGLITRARRYECAAAGAFLGRRGHVFDGLVALGGIQPGDDGCGTGYFAKRAARVVGPDGIVTGVDPSEAVVEYAARTAPPNCRFVVAGAERLPLPDNAYDVVISSLALHHLHPALRQVALHEVRRVLRPEGRLLLVDFRPPSSRFARRLVTLVGGHAMSHNPVDGLLELVVTAGLTVLGTGDRRPLLRYVQAMK